MTRDPNATRMPLKSKNQGLRTKNLGLRTKNLGLRTKTYFLFFLFGTKTWINQLTMVIAILKAMAHPIPSTVK